MARKFVKPRKPPAWSLHFEQDPLYPFPFKARRSALPDTLAVASALPPPAAEPDDEQPASSESWGSIERRYR